jgi:catechol 2,3-dioxygenase-like lactoylglutathione lyase family enzyme
MGKVMALEHVAIQVSDIERSMRFYERHLGFAPLFRVTRDEPYVQRVVGYHPDVTLEIAELAIPGTDVRLEIVEYRGVERTAIDPATANPGTMHFSLFVDDLREIYDRLLADGVEFVSEPQRSDAGHLRGGMVVYLKDPDGIRVELVQPPAVAA